MEIPDAPSQPPSTKVRRPGRPAGRTQADGVIADRETLLDAAERLIGASGPGVSLDAIALAAGVTKPILYRGVGDRDTLINTLAERLNGRMAEWVGREVDAARSPHDAVRRLVSGYLDHASRERNLYLFVSGGGSGEDRVRDLLRLADMTTRRFAEGIASYRAARGADPAVATVWSYGLVGALHYVTLWLLRDSSRSSAEVAAQLTQMLWTGFSLEDD
jgi:AcrR family transcriptional regulator